MNNFEKKIYPPLKQKQNMKVQTRKQVQNKTNVKTLKNNYKETSNKSRTSSNESSKGFINIILGSIIAIALGIILFVMIR